MKKVILIVVIVILGIFMGFLVNTNFESKSENVANFNNSISNENVYLDKDVVVIQNNKIQNEYLIDEFIENIVTLENEDFELKIMQDKDEIKLTYTHGDTSDIKNEGGSDIAETISPVEANKKMFGYYSLYINNELKGEFARISHSIKRCVNNENVILYFDAQLIEYIERPEICTYSLESSNYNCKFELSYIQRRDVDIKTIYEYKDYEVKTYGGDVNIVIEGDMVYDLKDALEQNVITSEDIINQAKIDSKYGLCFEGNYSDGGSTEYCYNDKYTILKLNTLDGEKDLVIGMKGQILSSYNKNK